MKDEKPILTGTQVLGEMMAEKAKAVAEEVSKAHCDSFKNGIGILRINRAGDISHFPIEDVFKWCDTVKPALSCVKHPIIMDELCSACREARIMKAALKSKIENIANHPPIHPPPPKPPDDL